MSQNVSFNLVDEPWICVRDLDGTTREVSLLELFEQASSIKCLANDLPTQDFAILRVLLAVLQRAISPALDDDDVPAEVWGAYGVRTNCPSTRFANTSTSGTIVSICLTRNSLLCRSLVCIRQRTSSLK